MPIKQANKNKHDMGRQDGSEVKVLTVQAWQPELAL